MLETDVKGVPRINGLSLTRLLSLMDLLLMETYCWCTRAYVLYMERAKSRVC